MSRNQVIVLRNVDIAPYRNEARLHLQWCRFDIGETCHFGYRFMWSSNGKLRPLRGGARIPTWEALKKLQQLAEDDGWAHQVEPQQSSAPETNTGSVLRSNNSCFGDL